MSPSAPRAVPRPPRSDTMEKNNSVQFAAVHITTRQAEGTRGNYVQRILFHFRNHCHRLIPPPPPPCLRNEKYVARFSQHKFSSNSHHGRKRKELDQSEGGEAAGLNLRLSFIVFRLVLKKVDLWALTVTHCLRTLFSHPGKRNKVVSHDLLMKGTAKARLRHPVGPNLC